MDKHNNLQQKKEKLLFCSMAIAALGLVGASPSIVSATTTAPVQSQDTEQNQNDGQPIVTDWNGLKISYNQKSHEVTIPSGTITNPQPLRIANGIDPNEIKSIKFEGKLTINDSAYALFSDLPKLEKIDLTNVDTSNVTNMDLLFAFCSSLKEVDGITDTANVTSMGAMFHGCSSLTNLDLSHFNTS
ncbi:MAG: BspA family leucine-rich repeat surface protein, partial [Lactobacillus sp.]|nr:BspA family leucine-rich repeat surface protein [Lactobacillus sp.]